MNYRLYVILTLIVLLCLTGTAVAQNLREAKTQPANPGVTAAADALTLTAPNGGEQWSAASNRNITWTSAGTIANVQIEYSTNAGVSYQVITSSAPNTGTYLWTVPNTATASARVRISNAASVNTKDVSNSLFTIVGAPASTITLLTPNGGENWTAGSSTMISWTTTGTIATVNIEYSVNGGVAYSTIASSASNTGSYTWTVPNTPTASARIRVSDASNPSQRFDVSNALFTIIGEPQPTITLTSPNGGERWTVGEAKTITWTSTGSFANVQIEYSSNAGGTYNVVTSGAPNTGSYSWTVPNSPTASARVRISNAANSFVTNDVSNALFTITTAPVPTITLTSPNGGERWNAGSNNTITWTSTGSFANVKIEYSKNAGVTYSVITTSAPNTGSYVWTVPNTPTASARVRISNAASETVTKDISNSLFTILSAPNPTITLTTPNGGEQWIAGSNNTITWSSTGSLANVKIEYSRNAGVTYSVVAASVPNTGSYVWTVPNTPTTSARVRVSDAANSTAVRDASNGNFSIVDATLPSLTLTSPNGGESWIIGATQTITWTTSGSPANVRLEYSVNAGVTYSTIIGSVANTGSYPWVVPNSQTASARVRISDATNITSTSDVSNANFSIVPAPSPTLTLTSPNGGEQWVIGSIYTITWNSTGAVGNVKLEYSTNGGASFSLIATTLANTGIYSWTVPNAATAAARIRISDVSKPTTVKDVSNANFSIVNASTPTLTLTSPNGGEEWTVGSIHNITWTSTGLATFAVVIIEYSTNGENGPYSVISTAAVNNGSYAWVVPNPITSSARVRISSVANEVPASDISNTDFMITPSLSLTVTSPNGFESWTTNSTRMITWTSIGAIANVKIEYSTDENLDFSLVTASTPNTGSYQWVVPNHLTTRATIKISDVANPSVRDLSNAYFIISPPAPSITLTAPNGGEVWNAGSSKAITWTTTGILANVRIEYSTNAGATFAVITSSAPNTGSYTWNVLNSPSAFSRVRVSDVSNPLNTFDVSDANFTIAPPTAPTFMVTYPNGGENVVAGSITPITWISNTSLTNVRIEYSTNAGVSFSIVTVNTPNTGSYSWTVPNAPTASARIRISDAANTLTSYDVSDNNFTIVPSSTPTIIITSPNGGEDWSVGISKNITWTSLNLPSFAVMKIEYSLSGVNGPYRLITSSAANSGRYTWVPPMPTTSSARIRVSTLVQGVTYTDISNTDFTISPALSLTITSPNGGENWIMNSVRNITWNSTGSIANVKIEYSINGNATFTLVAASAPNTGSYSWVVPGPATHYGSVRISDAAYPTVRDLSNTFFFVSSPAPGTIPNQPQIAKDEEPLPEIFSLGQNYPNPFNPVTLIHYQLSDPSIVTLKIFNVLGNEVATLSENKLMEPGVYATEFNAANLASGIYFYRLTAKTTGDASKIFTDVKKMFLMR